MLQVLVGVPKENLDRLPRKTGVAQQPRRQMDLDLLQRRKNLGVDLVLEGENLPVDHDHDLDEEEDRLPAVVLVRAAADHLLLLVREATVVGEDGAVVAAAKIFTRNHAKCWVSLG